MDPYPTHFPIIEQTSRRAEVLSGPERRRRWTFEQKAGVVAESLTAGAVASEVARRHGIPPNQLSGWRREVRAAATAPEFVAVTVAADPIATQSPVIRPSEFSGIELRIGDAELRIGRDVEPGAIMAVILSLKAAS